MKNIITVFAVFFFGLEISFAGSCYKNMNHPDFKGYRCPTCEQEEREKRREEREEQYLEELKKMREEQERENRRRLYR